MKIDLIGIVSYGFKFVGSKSFHKVNEKEQTLSVYDIRVMWKDKKRKKKADNLSKVIILPI